MSESPATDKSAAFTGLIVTAATLFVIMFAIVLLTNAKYAGHEKGAEGKTGAPAAQEPTSK